MNARIGLAGAAATIAAAVLVAGAVSANHDRMLYGCAYVTNLGDSSDVNVLIWDKKAPGAHGWVKFRGSGINKTAKFQLDSFGWHTVKFHVTSFDTEHISVGLDKPKLTYSFDFKLDLASDVTKKSCKPH